MISSNDTGCPNCGGKLKHYDNVQRMVQTKGGCAKWIKIKRFRCKECGKVHRLIPDYVLPYKHYESEIIRGVVEGYISPDTYGYEDYPCEVTMNRWKKQI